MDKTKITTQTERFRKGFPWLEIEASATPGRGIEVLDEKQAAEAAAYADSAEVKGKCKFVPASGAASRMFNYSSLIVFIALFCSLQGMFSISVYTLLYLAIISTGIPQNDCLQEKRLFG